MMTFLIIALLIIIAAAVGGLQTILVIAAFAALGVIVLGAMMIGSLVNVENGDDKMDGDTDERDKREQP
jgi:UPF0716 family protein affecting phage T7 exclusion